MIGPPVRFLTSAAIVVVAFLNLWHLNQSLRWVKPREADDVVILEDRLRFVRDTLMKEKYWRGDVGYMPAGVLQGHPRTSVDDEQWVLLRYVMIPWNVLENTLGAPYVLLDGRRSSRPVETPAGFIKIYDSANGLVVLKKLSGQ
jgi:hypothetical protein